MSSCRRWHRFHHGQSSRRDLENILFFQLLSNYCCNTVDMHIFFFLFFPQISQIFNTINTNLPACRSPMMFHFWTLMEEKQNTFPEAIFGQKCLWTILCSFACCCECIRKKTDDLEILKPLQPTNIQLACSLPLSFVEQQ